MKIISLIHICSEINSDLIIAQLIFSQLLTGSRFWDILWDAYDFRVARRQPWLSEELVWVHLVSSLKLWLNLDPLRVDLSLGLCSWDSESGANASEGFLDLSIFLSEALHLSLLVELDHLWGVTWKLADQVMWHDGWLPGLLVAYWLVRLDFVGLFVEEWEVLWVLVESWFLFLLSAVIRCGVCWLIDAELFVSDLSNGLVD